MRELCKAQLQSHQCQLQFTVKLWYLYQQYFLKADILKIAEYIHSGVDVDRTWKLRILAKAIVKTRLILQVHLAEWCG